MAVSNTDISGRISARIASATEVEIPGIVVSESRAARNSGDHLIDPCLDPGQMRVELADAIQMQPDHEAVMLGEPAGQRLDQLRLFRPNLRFDLLVVSAAAGRGTEKIRYPSTGLGHQAAGPWSLHTGLEARLEALRRTGVGRGRDP